MAGTSKNRVSYDILSIFQWISGFCSIIKEETNVKTKNAMLEYVSDIMDDAQDFDWASIKGAHALSLFKMEEGKLDWHMTSRLDRLRKAHAQKLVSGPNLVITRKAKMIIKVHLAGFFFKMANVHTKMIIVLLQEGNFTNIFAATVMG